MTRALILAAGQGKRLRPLTNKKPKCLVELGNKSLLTRQINTLRRCNINDIAIVTGYRSTCIEVLGFKTYKNWKYKTTNMVASLFSAIPFLDSAKDADVVISYGDIVYEDKNLLALLDCPDEIAIMVDSKWIDLWSVRMSDPLKDAETLKLDNNNYITELGKKPTSYTQIQGQYTGLIKFRSDMIKRLINFYKSLDRNIFYANKNFDNMYMTTFLQLLIDDNWKAKAVIVKSGWLEVDSLEDLNKYKSLLIQDRLSVFYATED
ncbi:MAG: nucleotidyl transferase [Gammaproteobacteria bacterium RIFCSPHIGHO2_12_FULL_38_14]|nr:MAG: nucleotidyl transferase [Gammaproteobacteria bacterium RIFCSPHIGHO2_12_FULL_38_14]